MVRDMSSPTATEDALALVRPNGLPDNPTFKVDMDREKAAIGHDRRHGQPRIARADQEGQEAGIPEKAASDVEMIEDERRVGGERDDADGQRGGSYYGPTNRPAFGQPYGEVCRALPASVVARPTLVVGASKAPFVTEVVLDRLGRLLGDALAVEFLDSGHMLYWERFEETAQLVASFLA